MKTCGGCGCIIVQDFAQCPKCGMDMYKNQKKIVVVDLKDRQDIMRRINNLKPILNNARNKKCRLCDHDLKCGCSDCSVRQYSPKFSNISLKSMVGYRRADFMLHTICGRIFIQSKFGIQLLPSISNQMTLEQTLFT